MFREGTLPVSFSPHSPGSQRHKLGLAEQSKPSGHVLKKTSKATAAGSKGTVRPNQNLANRQNLPELPPAANPDDCKGFRAKELPRGPGGCLQRAANPDDCKAAYRQATRGREVSPRTWLQRGIRPATAWPTTISSYPSTASLPANAASPLPPHAPLLHNIQTGEHNAFSHDSGGIFSARIDLLFLELFLYYFIGFPFSSF